MPSKTTLSHYAFPVKKTVYKQKPPLLAVVFFYVFDVSLRYLTGATPICFLKRRLK